MGSKVVGTELGTTMLGSEVTGLGEIRSEFTGSGTDESAEGVRLGMGGVGSSTDEDRADLRPELMLISNTSLPRASSWTCMEGGSSEAEDTLAEWGCLRGPTSSGEEDPVICVNNSKYIAGSGEEDPVICVNNSKYIASSGEQ